MFNSKTKSIETPVGSATIIGAGTVIHGDIESSGDIRIDGTLIGNISAKAKVLIGTEGMVEGNINCQEGDILGKIKGNLNVMDLLQLRGKCNVNGDLMAGKLQVEPSAVFNGSCHMGANVVELNSELGNAVNS
jgi:cytoskeletal protein CcmA (bactofilin family)